MTNDPLLTQPWLGWAMELQSIAQCGLAYVHDIYDRERYERLRDIAAEMLACKTGLSTREIKNLFCNESGYQTPKLDTRAVLFDAEGRILLVQENSGLWCLPGGWADVTQTLKQNALKELREEAGIEARALRVIALQDHASHNPPPLPWRIVKVFVECEPLGGQFVPNSETIASDWFQVENPPPLATGKTTQAQLLLCARAHAQPCWQPVFD